MRNGREGMLFGTKSNFAKVVLGILVFQIAFPTPLWALTKSSTKKSNPAPPSSKVTIDELIGHPQAIPEETKTPPSTTTEGPQAKSIASAMAISTSTVVSQAQQPQNWANQFHVDPASGSGSFALPFYAPPGRGNIQPGVTLTYSLRRGNEAFGVGWGVDFGVIERSTKNGVPHYDDTDTFVGSLGGNNFELVPIGGHEYRAKVESAFFKFTYQDGIWEIKDRQGTTYYLGLDTLLGDQSREKNGDKIFRWYLSEIRDIHGNYCFIRHFKSGAFEVLYTGEPGTDREAFSSSWERFPIQIRAEVETVQRPDIVSDFRAGFESLKTQRIHSITVYAQGLLQRRYDFEYKNSSRTGRSLLTKITEYGDDGVTARRPVQFSYTDATAPTYSKSTIGIDPTTGDNLFNVRLNGGDYFHSNEYILYPHYGSNPDKGVFSNGIAIDWGPKYTQASYSDPRWSWSHGLRGDFHYWGSKDTAFYAWTYLYSNKPKTINVSANGDIYHMFLNGNYASAGKAGDYSLQPGYNILEVTGYNQNNRNFCDIYTALADQVDVMNSAQVVLPQISGDFNGDGLMDVATFFSETGTVKVALSTGMGFLPKSTWIDNFGIAATPLVADFNADGYADIGMFTAAIGEWIVALSDGKKFNTAGTGLSNFGNNQTPFVIDVNGDGWTDVGYTYKEGGNLRGRIAVNNKVNFEVLPKVYSLGAENETAMAGDFNADGLMDFVTQDATTGRWTARINQGDLGSEFQPNDPVLNFGIGFKPVVADFNSDGATDIGYYDYGQGKIYYRPARGRGFGDSRMLPFDISVRQSEAQIQTGDFNGDGLSDFSVFNEKASLEFAFSRGSFPDLMAKAQNGLGGLTELAYFASTVFPKKFFPFVLPVVASVASSSGQGDRYVTEFSYADALYQPENKEFYGFGRVRITDPLGHYTETQFLQDDLYRKGLVKESAVYDRSGNLYSKTLNQWDVQDISPKVKFVYLKRMDHLTYDGDATGRRKAEEFYYDESPQLGNLTRTIELGEVDLATGTDVGQDTRIVETQFSNNAEGSNWLLGLPKQRVLRDAGAAIVRKTEYYYDGHGLLDDRPSRGLVTKKVEYASLQEGSTNPVTQYSYDAYGNLTQIRDPQGSLGEIIYDSQYHTFPVTQRNALGHEVKKEYYGIGGVALQTGDGFHGIWGQQRAAIDANKQKSQSIYDTFGRTTAIILPLDSREYPTRRYEYFDSEKFFLVKVSQRLQHGLPMTSDQASFYDGMGRLIQSKRTSGRLGWSVVEGQVEYDARGLVAKTYLPRFTTLPIEIMDPINPPLPKIATIYDALGRVVKIIQPDQSYQDVRYNDGSIIGCDANGHQQKTDFDAYGRVTRREEFTGADGRSSYYPKENYQTYAATLYEYDPAGNLTQVVDAKGNKIKSSYDLLGRRVKTEDPDMGVWQYGYDLNSNLAWQGDAKGQKIYFTYDSIGRLITKTDKGRLNVKYVYDDAAVPFSVGRLTQVQYGNWPQDMAGFSYDALGRENLSMKRIDGVDYEIRQKFDALGHRIEIEYPDHRKVSYLYNIAGELGGVACDFSTGIVSVTPPLPPGTIPPGTTAPLPTILISSVEYNAQGQVAKIMYSNGQRREYEYDGLNQRLVKIRSVNNMGKILQDFKYQYDPVGNIIRITDSINKATQLFKYDARNRLVEAIGAGYGTLRYQYDAIGNSGSNNGIVNRYGENGAGPHALTSDSTGRTLEYDPNGNLARILEGQKTTRYLYDAENRLIEIQVNGARQTQFEYDGDGGRIKRTVYSSTPKTTKFIGAFAEVSQGALMNFVYMGPKRIGVQRDQFYSFFDDHLGSMNVMTDARGNVVELAEYQPFGAFSRRETMGTTSSFSKYYFNGQGIEEDAGLYYYGSRYYAPQLGRFITADPIVPNPNDPQTLNRYAYVNNNPVNYIDPSGNFPWLAAIIGAVIGGAAAGIGNYQATGKFDFGNFALGALSGGLSGASLGMNAAALKGLGPGGFLVPWSGGASLAAQVAGAFGWDDLSQNLSYLGMGLAGTYAAIQIGAGIQSWAWESQFKLVRKDGGPSQIWPGETVHVNGMVTSFEKAKEEAFLRAGADVLAFNPTTSALADLTESTLDKLTFTSSVSRQLKQKLVGLSGIKLSGFSQGGMIIANTALALGLSGQHEVISQLTIASSQVSQLRAYLSGAIAMGEINNKVIYGAGSIWDFSNFLGPNLNPVYFAGGVVGTAALPWGIGNHYLPK